MRSLVTLRKQGCASNCCGHLRSIADQEGVLEGTSAGVGTVEAVSNPSGCVKDVLTWGMFAMGSAHVESGLEVAEMAHGDMLHAVDSSPYPVPTHDDPNRLPDHFADRYHLAPGGTHEESDEGL